MTGILLCLAAILLLVGALYLVLCHEPLVAAWWYRFVQDPDSFGGQLLRALRRDHGDPYPPEAAEVPDPVNEAGDEYQRASWFTGADEMLTKPAVVAGDDLLVAKLVGELQSAYLAYRRGEDVCVGAPAEPSPEVQR